jgi:hypothetical protein
MTLPILHHSSHLGFLTLVCTRWIISATGEPTGIGCSCLKYTGLHKLLQKASHSTVTCAKFSQHAFP